ncbi:MAG: hypothetical protein ACYTKD_08605 [Planctomycetota bacterium]
MPIDYSTIPFQAFHLEIMDSGGITKVAPAKRTSFWQFVPPGSYDAVGTLPLLCRYVDSLEEELEERIAVHSIAYWLHIYRRLFPGPIGDDAEPATIALTRATLEAAIQKYGQRDPCSGVALSSEVDPSRILRGSLVKLAEAARRRRGSGPQSGPEQMLEDLKRNGQTVLTEFGPEELRQFYHCERLAYEVWRTMSLRRTVAKGAPLIVKDDPADVFDDRSEELDDLLQSHDARSRYESVSATGTVFPDPFRHDASGGLALFPSYNVHGLKADVFNDYFRAAFRVQFHMSGGEEAFNFAWWPYNLGGFYKAHMPLASAFEAEHGLPFEAVVALIGALYLRMSVQWREKPFVWIARAYQRAYEGPYTRHYVLDEMLGFSRTAAGWLGIDRAIKDADVERAVGFLSLPADRTELIGVDTHGPHAVFLPYGDDRLFIDYAYIQQRLYYLFFGVHLDDQNFKGEALEVAVGPGTAGLPRKLHAEDGSEKEIDAAFGVGDALLLVECRARARSIGVDRGDLQAIGYRRRVVEEAIRDADDKARWLAQRPCGRNYDVTRFTRILGVGVSPFVEFMHSADSKYWLAGRIPRVLTPAELKDVLEERSLAEMIRSSPWASHVRAR